MTESIFEMDADGRFVPTGAALGPWSDQALHGGPPTMLLAREIERFPADAEMFVSRLTVELLRPVGRTPLAVTSRLVRPGRKVQLVEASLWNGPQEVARATALRIRHSQVEVPSTADPLPHPEPESVAPWSGGWRRGDAYHVIGVDIRGPEPGTGPAPGWAWFRLKLPLVPGEKPTPLIRICAAADFPNGISFVVDPRKTSFVNPDLNVFVIRPPVDEWVLVDARTWLETRGTGMAEGALYDRGGRIGRSMQSLIVESVTGGK
ncbi:MAG TPA: thioesterase family protein [Candidatus Dormibacteraeota bacterium]|nr:thioesterase family protein [Candidatus Dormibacteraeota bacterium]